MATTLYFGPGACSMAPHIILHELGKPFEAKAVALRKGQQRTPEYLKINPKGKVPVLDDNGRIVTEIVAIMAYLGRNNPDAGIWIKDDMEKQIRTVEMMSWCTSGMHPLFGRLFRPTAFADIPGAEENVKKLGAEAIKQAFAITNDMLAGKEFAVGNQFTVADAHLFPFFRWATNMKVDTSGAPNYAAHYERMLKRPSVQKMLDTEKAAQDAIDKAA